MPDEAGCSRYVTIERDALTEIENRFIQILLILKDFFYEKVLLIFYNSVSLRPVMAGAHFVAWSQAPCGPMNIRSTLPSKHQFYAQDQTQLRRIQPANMDLRLLQESKAELQEAILLIRFSLPVIAAYLVQNSFQTISMMLVGQFYPESLSVAAFSYMFSTCTGWLIGMGGLTALDTLASTAFTGCDKHYTGILLQRATIVLSLLYIPVAVIWVYAEPLFVALGQDKVLSHESARFLTHLIPGGLG
ncbi:MatE family transporter [Colletotrichum higginsianum IMI 349063]|uniref:MatE family transporter n=1 Tax=Colletotrichum higginsianum (strain IMI 349063) TaxID=759273 RepID=A0A1B7XR29_COLHI|nr:MatE family transporter [Colletotrichum higginsianum IMI 349063]OBR02223.1 MatE family transporter [Colletotrichum higginsianum IMI 349063]